MPVMAKRRKPKEASASAPNRPTRSGVAINAWIDEQIAAALDDYVASTDPRVSKTAAIEAALRDFLRKQGMWPRPVAGS
jgi:hypothetical protein